jgi:hypothetical protein
MQDYVVILLYVILKISSDRPIEEEHNVFLVPIKAYLKLAFTVPPMYVTM